MKTGLVSITFRKLSPAEIVSLVSRAGGESIEWGGDVHAPHGDVARAREVAQRTRDAGIEVSAYGSYYRLGESEAEGLAFAAVLDSAVALGAPRIRVWAGRKGSAEASTDDRERVAADALRVADLAAAAGVGIAYELHAGTLTDTRESALAFLAATDRPNITTFWQPYNGVSPEGCLASARDLMARISNVHAFHWWPTPANRLPLAAGEDRWMEYLRLFAADGAARHVSIEFVAGDSPEAYIADAATLRRLADACAKHPGAPGGR